MNIQWAKGNEFIFLLPVVFYCSYNYKSFLNSNMKKAGAIGMVAESLPENKIII